MPHDLQNDYVFWPPLEVSDIKTIASGSRNAAYRSSGFLGIERPRDCNFASTGISDRDLYRHLSLLLEGTQGGGTRRNCSMLYPDWEPHGTLAELLGPGAVPIVLPFSGDLNAHSLLNALGAHHVLKENISFFAPSEGFGMGEEDQATFGLESDGIAEHEMRVLFESLAGRSVHADGFCFAPSGMTAEIFFKWMATTRCWDSWLAVFMTTSFHN